MDFDISEWLNLFVRWVHVVAGITWIGQSYFFHWLDSCLTSSGSSRVEVVGETWMVHSGGFYLVEKQKFVPGALPQAVHWFKWEAALTWVSGLSLLTIVYYAGGVLVDPDSGVSVGQGVLIGLGLLIFGFVAYDRLCRSPLGRHEHLLVATFFVAILSIAFGLTRVLSGRAAYIHVGALFGTLMAANVWMRILPNQRKMIAATRQGQVPDEALGREAKLRSKHNSFMSVPLILIMISNHFPTASYGHSANWLMLGLFVGLGWAARKLLNRIGRHPEPTGG